MTKNASLKGKSKCHANGNRQQTIKNDKKKEEKMKEETLKKIQSIIK